MDRDGRATDLRAAAHARDLVARRRVSLFTLARRLGTSVEITVEEGYQAARLTALSILASLRLELGDPTG